MRGNLWDNDHLSMAFTKDCTNMPMSPDKLLVQFITICLLFLYDHQDLHEEKTSHFSYIASRCSTHVGKQCVCVSISYFIFMESSEMVQS